MKKVVVLFICLIFISHNIQAQCTPSFPYSCTSQYFTSISASGTGVVSTVSYSASSCTGTYYDNFSTQGVTAPTGSTVSFSVSRATGYAATLAIYVDYNNDGTFQSTELCGTAMSLSSGTATATYNFTIPLIGLTTNTNLRLRVFLGEGGSGYPVIAPCSAKYGECSDYYIDATCSVPSITVTPPAPVICSPGSTPLTATGAGATPTYEWYPASGLSVTTGASVTAAPAGTTTYTVRGYGPGVCLDSGSVVVTVSPAVTPVITVGGSSTFCSGGSVTLSETSGAGIIYQWYAGASPIPGATNSTYLASPSVTTTYSVHVTNALGCTGTASQTLTVLPSPTATVTPPGPVTLCAPATQVLTANFSAGFTYRWFDIASAIPGATMQTYTVAATGNYKVEITAANGCKDTSAGTVVVINPSPVASASATAPLTVCAYDEVVLSAVTTPGYSYQWLNGTTPVVGATNITYVANTPGTYNYRLKVTNGFGCADTTASGLFPVVVNPAPVSAISASGPLTICTGSTVTLSVPAVASNTYQWYYGATVASATPISGASSASYVAGFTGYYYVVVTTSAGCTTNSSATPALVNVVSLPEISYGSPASFCWGSTVTLSLGIGASVPGITYQWKLNGLDLPGGTGPDFVASISGVYTCVVNIAGGCIGTASPVTVTVYPLPNPIVHYTGGVLTTGNFYDDYKWYWHGGLIFGDSTYHCTPFDTGYYTVIVTDTNGCISAATTFLVHEVFLGVSQLTSGEYPILYPNPAHDRLFISYPENVHTQVSDLSGKLLIDSRSSKEIDISALSSGMYLITIYDSKGNKLLIEKVVKM